MNGTYPRPQRPALPVEERLPTHEGKWEHETTLLDRQEGQLRFSHQLRNLRAIFTFEHDAVDAYLYDSGGLIEAMAAAGKIRSKWLNDHRCWLHIYKFPANPERYQQTPIPAYIR